MRCRPAGRAPERAGNAGAAGARGARAAAGRRGRAADRGRQLRQPRARAADGGRAEEVVEAVGHVVAELSGLVLNERGWERFAATGLERVNVTLAATESFNQRNGNASLAAAAERAERILAVADRPATATISVAFGCPFEGAVDPGVVADLAERLVAAGASEIVLADTIGVGTPSPSSGCSSESRSSVSPWAGTSTTRATPASPARGRRSRRARRFSTPRSAGFGGCPFAPRATGNVATEDVLHLLDREGIETGVDLEALISVARWLEELLGRELPGRVYRAGRFPA